MCYYLILKFNLKIKRNKKQIFIKRYILNILGRNILINIIINIKSKWKKLTDFM